MVKNTKKGFSTVLIAVGIAVVMLIGLLGYGYHDLTSSKMVKAQLHVESGIVKVNGEKVSARVLLDERDLIETTDGLATVILYESVIINLDPNTKVTLEDLIREHPKVGQEGGTTWNKFTGLLGVEEYTIKEGNSVASVRATSFELSASKIIVGEGKVEYAIDGQQFTVTARRVVEKVDGEVIERDATPEELMRVREHMRRSIKELRYLRQLEIEKHPILVNQLKKKYDVSEEEIKQRLEEADNGVYDVDEMVEKSPIKIESAKKVAEITKVIQEINKGIKQLGGK